jgi:twitching motility protein PilT
MGLLDAMLARARDARASDLHLVATRPPLVRVAGELAPEGTPLDPAALEAMLMPLIPGPARARFDREGATDFALEHHEHGRFRVNVVRQLTGLKACFRLIAHEPPTLAALGLPEEITHAAHHHQGMILVTGPSGHGKSSTLAAIVDFINETTTHHVISIEDPVEFIHPKKKALISQREVGTHTKGLQAALKASLREDPDVIVVGDVRDPETAKLALAASETGHLVIGTMNTPSAAKTIERMIDLFPPGDQGQVRMTLAGGLKLVVSQRLIPLADRSGMVAAAELLPGSVPLWNLIRDNKTFQIPSLQQRGKGIGVIRLDDSLAELVRNGRVSLESACTVAEAPDKLDALARGKPVATAPDAPPAPAKEAMEPADGGGFLSKAGALFGKKRSS